MPSKENILAALAGVLLGIGGTLLAERVQKNGQASSPQSLRGGKHKTHKKCFVLVVTFTFRTVADLEKALEIWKPLAEHVAANEPSTLTYEASRCENNPTTLIISERYTDKQNANALHRASAPFKTYQQKIAEQTDVISKEMISGFEVDYGF